MRLVPAIAFLACSAPLHAQITIRASVGPGGLEANNMSTDACLSADGSVVGFSSVASNLVASDTNGVQDVFVRDLDAGLTELVSRSNSGGSANGPSREAAVSRYGQLVAFVSSATNLVPGGSSGSSNVFVRNRVSGTTTLVSAGLSGHGVAGICDQVALSANGRFIAFRSDASDLVAGDTNQNYDVFVFDRGTGLMEIASRNSAGLQVAGLHERPSLSDDGRYVALASTGPLAPGGYALGSNVFLRDRASGSVVCASVQDGGGPANGSSLRPSISGDGRCVAFCSQAGNLTANTLIAGFNIFVRDVPAGHTELVSRNGPQAANAACGSPSVSADGRFVAFDTQATNLTLSDYSPDWDVYVRDRWADSTALQSLSWTGSTLYGDAVALPVRFLSADGQTVVFGSSADSFVQGDTNTVEDVFVHGRGSPVVVNFCFGDGSSGACPCNNQGGFGRGCDNSYQPGGAQLQRTGIARLSLDTLVLRVHSEPQSVFNIFIQADGSAPPAIFGDGLLCLGGNPLRLYDGFNLNGAIARPGAGDPPVATRAAQLGFPIPMGATRCYQVLYRDPEDNYCPPPAGSSFNLSQAMGLLWGP